MSTQESVNAQTEESDADSARAYGSGDGDCDGDIDDSVEEMMIPPPEIFLKVKEQPPDLCRSQTPPGKKSWAIGIHGVDQETNCVEIVGSIYLKELFILAVGLVASVCFLYVYCAILGLKNQGRIFSILLTLLIPTLLAWWIYFGGGTKVIAYLLRRRPTEGNDPVMVETDGILRFDTHIVDKDNNNDDTNNTDDTSFVDDVSEILEPERVSL